jgi:hypothetical protein
MVQPKTGHARFPLREVIKSIPGLVGIHLEEKPKFEMLGKEGHVELRRYDPMLVAEVAIAGDHARGVDEGFDKLAKYIFGENTTHAEMSMTNPVFQEHGIEESAMAGMAAPVVREKGLEAAGDTWRISFVLPSKFSLVTVPKPLDPDIQLHDLPAATVGVVEYSGNNTEEHMEKAASILKAWLASTRRIALSPIRWAQYDAPFTVPFLKRNEALVDVRA